MSDLEIILGTLTVIFFVSFIIAGNAATQNGRELAAANEKLEAERSDHYDTKDEARRREDRLRRYLKLALLERGAPLDVEPVDDIILETIAELAVVYRRVDGHATINLAELPAPDERRSL